jgi:5-methylcytosine-specific restriction endonuclease McrA
MPDAPLRICASNGCPNRVRRGYCERCRQARGLERRTQQPKVAGLYGRQIDFYQSREWKALREEVRRDEPLCRHHAHCKGITEQIDHIIPREQGGPDTRDNLAGLCASCHSAKTRAEMLATGRTGAHHASGG